MKEKKPRTLVIEFDASKAEEFADLQGIAIDKVTGEVLGVYGDQLQAIPGKTKLRVQRKRTDKHPKVLHESESPTGTSYLNANHQLYEYDHLIAIDTNTKNYNERCSVSVTAALHLIPGSSDANMFCATYSLLFLFECWNVKEKPENLGWWHVINAVKGAEEQFSGKIGLVVDSDYGNLSQYNAREKPFYEDFYLPERMTFTYASDQGGADLLSTKMINYCDTVAKQLVREENLLLNTSELVKSGCDNYTHLRAWDTESKDILQFIDTFQSNQTS